MFSKKSGLFLKSFFNGLGFKTHRGQMQWESVNIIIAVLLFLVGVGMIAYLYSGGGAKILDSIKKMLRFGRIILILI